MVLAGAVLVTALASGNGDAAAQGSLDARYQVTLGGISFGRGAWQVNVSDGQFTSAVSGTTTGVMRMFSTGQGTSASRGSVASGGVLNASSYSSSIATTKKYDEVRMQLSSGTVKDFMAEPPTSPDPQRVPIQDAHRRGVLDPMTAAIIRVPGNGDTFVPEACNRRLAIFDGRMRYDLQLAYKRLDRVRSDKGYQGTVVVCSVVFRADRGTHPEPAGDQIPGRAARNRDLAGADCRNPADGAISDFAADAVRRGCAAGDAIRHGSAGDAADADQRQTLAPVHGDISRQSAVRQGLTALAQMRRNGPNRIYPI